MNPLRLCTLSAGPLLLVGVSYWLTFADGHLPGLRALAELPRTPRTFAPVPDQELQGRCETAAGELLSRMAPGCHALVEPPFVLAGDFPPEQLREHYQQTILPTWRALSTAYFDRKPNCPVLIVVCSSDASYQDHAQRLDRRRGAAYYGYYQRDQHRLVINASTGNGTLAHELTHALAQFDFPDMPEWFDEGLASLHEQSEINAAETDIRGLVNWRLHYLLQALDKGQLQSLATLMSRGSVRSGMEAVDYAHTRYLCLYLQQRGLLRPFYRKFREGIYHDPTGMAALCELLRVDSLDQVDRDFEGWARKLTVAGAVDSLTGDDPDTPERLLDEPARTEGAPLSTRVPAGAQRASD